VVNKDVKQVSQAAWKQTNEHCNGTHELFLSRVDHALNIDLCT